MKVIFFGTPDFVVPILKILHESFDVIGVVTTPDTIQGRKKIITPTPVKEYGLDKIEKAQIISTDRLDEEITKKLSSLRPDLFVVAAYGIIIPKNILSIPKYGSINIHPSLLPKYRGPSPIQTALLHGEKENGITIIQMDEEVDHGPILKKIPFEVTPNDTFATLHQKMFQKAADELPQIIREYASGKIQLTPQDHTQATFTQHITREDGFVDLSGIKTSSPLEIKNLKLEIARKIRAYYPWPTAWTIIRIKNKELRIKFLPDKKVQLEGGKPITLKEFLNGYPDLKEIVEMLI
jgi:methionyl-tRNA formyltransferase